MQSNLSPKQAFTCHDHPGSDRVGECLSCNGAILVEEHGHSPSPSPILVGGPRIITFIRSMYVAGFASVFGDGLSNVCVIDAELAPFYGAPMVG